jgi:hypothetical protein
VVALDHRLRPAGPGSRPGGKFLLVGPDYDGPLPDSGYHIGHSRTTKAFMLGRAFINENPGMDPAPTVETIKRTTKIYPYTQGGFGTSIATLLEGQVRSDPTGRDSRDGVRRGEREGVQHDPAE